VIKGSVLKFFLITLPAVVALGGILFVAALWWLLSGCWNDDYRMRRKVVVDFNQPC
jgi:hypothetical protein